MSLTDLDESKMGQAKDHDARPAIRQSREGSQRYHFTVPYLQCHICIMAPAAFDVMAHQATIVVYIVRPTGRVTF